MLEGGAEAGKGGAGACRSAPSRAGKKPGGKAGAGGSAGKASRAGSADHPHEILRGPELPGDCAEAAGLRGDGEKKTAEGPEKAGEASAGGIPSGNAGGMCICGAAVFRLCARIRRQYQHGGAGLYAGRGCALGGGRLHGRPAGCLLDGGNPDRGSAAYRLGGSLRRRPGVGDPESGIWLENLLPSCAGGGGALLHPADLEGRRPAAGGTGRKGEAYASLRRNGASLRADARAGGNGSLPGGLLRADGGKRRSDGCSPPGKRGACGLHLSSERGRVRCLGLPESGALGLLRRPAGAHHGNGRAGKCADRRAGVLHPF